MTMNGVIETVTGDLLRAGYCTFTTDGSFDESTETERTDVPFPCKVKDDEFEIYYHRWTGTEWVEVLK